MSRNYRTYSNASKTSKAWKYLANSTSDGDTTIFVSEKKISGRPPSKRVEGSLSHALCSLDLATHQPPSNASSTSYWNLGIRNGAAKKAKTTWMTSASQPSSRTSTST